MARLRDVNFVQLDFMETLLNIQNHNALVSIQNFHSLSPVLTEAI